MPASAVLYLLAQEDADALTLLSHMAGDWGGPRFEVIATGPGHLPATSRLTDAALVVAVDAGAAALCRRLAVDFEDFSVDPAGSWPQRLIQLMRAQLGAAEHDAFSVEHDVRIEAREPLHDGFVQLERIHFRHRLYSGGWSKMLVRETMHRCAAVGVLPYDPQRDEILLIEQIRIAAIRDRNGPWLLEMIAGLVDPGEQPEEVCRRESLEEAGVVIGDLELIAEYLPSTGISDENMLVYRASFDSSQAGGVHGLIEEGEDIRVLTLKTAQAFDLLASGRISNAATIIALQWLMLNIERLRRA